jgi:hypothetical protein
VKGASQIKLSSRRQRGFTIAELSVVMFLTVLITGVLVVFYAQSRLTLERGVSLTELQQRTRMAAIRIIPKLASSIRLPPNLEHPTYPDGLDPVAWPYRGNEPTNVVVMNTTQEFIQTQMRQPITIPFDPRWPAPDPDTGVVGPNPYGLLRIKFHPLGTKVVGTDSVGDDIIVTHGEVRMDVYDGAPIPQRPSDPGDPLPANFATFGLTPSTDLLAGDDLSDDIIIASNVSDVTFEKKDNDNRRISMRAVSLGAIRNATSGESLSSQVYETEVFLPVFTNSGG